MQVARAEGESGGILVGVAQRTAQGLEGTADGVVALEEDVQDEDITIAQAPTFMNV